MNCRHCQNKLEHVFLDLGFAPPSNAYLEEADLNKPEVYFPLKLYVCSICWLVQTADYASREELFNDNYSYFSSISESWLNHAFQYCEKITNSLELNGSSQIIEIGSNDGYLLKNFVENGIPSLGIEPTSGTADKAISLGIPVIKQFFSLKLAKQLAGKGQKADLIIGNNVYAHVPDINDFTAGIKMLLKERGTVTLEFPHVLNLLKFNQFDTVYHEHFSYLSVFTTSKIFEENGLRIFKVEKLSTHGGSVRVYGCNFADTRVTEPSVKEIMEQEKNAGMQDLKIYDAFQEKTNTLKNDLVSFLIEKKQKNEVVAAYGAAAKGNTLLNYAGIKPDLLSFVCDAAPSKQGKFMPGSHIPILHPNALIKLNPKWVLILPWNISSEIIQQQSELKNAGARFVVAVPDLTIIA